MSNFFRLERVRDALHARGDGLVIAEPERRRRASTRNWNSTRQLERHLRACQRVAIVSMSSASIESPVSMSIQGASIVGRPGRPAPNG